MLSRRRDIFFLIIPLILSACLARTISYDDDNILPALSQRAAENMTASDFSWDNIEPSENLDSWTPCYGGFLCARLSVPMNWNSPNSTSTPKVAIALTKLPAKVAESSQGWKGPMLINPGGPGGSGVLFALQAARALQNLIGPEYSILGFDPRGVNNTTPAITCFSTPLERSVWGLYNQDVITQENLPRGYARSKALGSFCEPLASGAEGGAAYVNTPSVARDMLAITEASWRVTNLPDSEVSKKGLQYWGLSYGSALGMTFASMFPDRVERVVVDGIVDLDDYYGGLWRKNLQDAHLVSNSFFEYCSAAGAANCSFHGGEPAEVIATKLDDLLEKLRREPLPIDTTLEGPDIVTDSDILVMLFVAWYKPIDNFPIIAAALALAEKGNGAEVIDRIRGVVTCDSTPGLANTGAEANTAILCSDAPAKANNLTLSEFREYLGLLEAQNRVSGVNWAKVRLNCMGWKVRPEGLVHTGAWGRHTKAGVLFVGNTADPVTPLVNARTMQKLFSNSALLVQNSSGHCSLSSPSLCSAKIIRNYFRSGELPQSEEGAYCEVDELPFGIPVNGMLSSPGDEELKLAAKEASQAWVPSAFGPKRSS